MPPHERNKLNRIEELKGRLFSRNYQTKIEYRDSFTHSHQQDMPDEWDDEGKGDSTTFYFPGVFLKRTSMFKKFFKFSLTFFILTLLYGSYVLFFGGNTVSNDNIDISILGNNFTAGGEELSLIIGITNRNSSSLDLVDLVMEYPKSSPNVGTDLSAGTERNRLSLGTIPVGVVRNENLKLVLFGQQGSVRPIKISIEYRVEGSNAIFVKEKLYEVTINSTPINLSVDAPSILSPNQEITLNAKISLNATRPTTKILLKFDYPTGFQFLKSTPAPTLGNNVWSLGDFALGAERSISITGKMVDVFDAEEKIFHISSGSQSSTDKFMIDVVFNSLSHLVTIKKSFIEANLFVNGVLEKEYKVESKASVNGQIRWTNNLETKVNDLEIQAKILGNAVNRKTISAQQGFYDSAKDVIIWDKNSQNQFKEIDPGASGSVSFSLYPLSLFSAEGGLLSDPSMTIEVSIHGKQSLEGYTTEELTSSTSNTIKIISDVGFTAKTLYYFGPFTNTGLIPPKVEKQTTYTVVWSLSNTANNISKGTIRSTLPPWIRFVGPFFPSDEDLKYNPSTKEIVWNIGSIPKGTGITKADKSVSFQIAFTPSLSQLGTTPTLINEAVLTGHDDFANVDVRASRLALNTTLINDPTFPVSGGAVTE